MVNNVVLALGGLKECPFCSDEKAPAVMSALDIDGSLDAETHENNFAVCCRVGEGGCGATSGYARSKKQATIQWNRRGY